MDTIPAADLEERTLDLSQFGEKQRKFLIARPNFTTDKDAALECGLNPKRVSDWKREIDGFREAIETVLDLEVKRQQGILTADRDEYIEKNLVDPALVRLKEILSIQINRHTDAATIAQVRMALTTVLHDRGILIDSDTDPQRATVIIQQYIDAGRKYKPAWGSKVQDEQEPSHEAKYRTLD